MKQCSTQTLDNVTAQQWDRGTEGQTDRGIKGRLHSENGKKGRTNEQTE